MKSRILGLILPIVLSAGLASRAEEGGSLFGQTKEDLARRRAAVRAAAAGALVLYFGPGENEDIERSRFRTSNEMMYLTGVEAPQSCLALLPDGDPSGRKEILFLRAKSPGAGRWTDPVPGPDEQTLRETGIESVEDVRRIWEVLKPSIASVSAVQLAGSVGRTRAPASQVGIGALVQPNGAAEEAIRAIRPEVEIRGGAERLTYALRWIKSAGEIANLRAAIAATGQAERAAARSIRPGAREIEVEGAILAEFRKGGAVREGFPGIVGGGPNSLILHHFASPRKMQAGETVVVDIGAEYNYYTADITRTFPAAGRFSPRQREIYQLVLDCQKACQKEVRPGATTLADLHRFAVQYLRNSPLRARDAAGVESTMERFFVHGLGHSLGLDVHDVGGGGPLRPGAVFTIEPGIYIPREGIGIRIEDDYLVTDSGVEKLSAAIPSEIPEIEALMSSRPPTGARITARPPQARGSRTPSPHRSSPAGPGGRKLPEIGREPGALPTTG